MLYKQELSTFPVSLTGTSCHPGSTEKSLFQRPEFHTEALCRSYLVVECHGSQGIFTISELFPALTEVLHYAMISSSGMLNTVIMFLMTES